MGKKKRKKSEIFFKNMKTSAIEKENEKKERKKKRKKNYCKKSKRNLLNAMHFRDAISFLFIRFVVVVVVLCMCLKFENIISIFMHATTNIRMSKKKKFLNYFHSCIHKIVHPSQASQQAKAE